MIIRQLLEEHQNIPAAFCCGHRIWWFLYAACVVAQLSCTGKQGTIFRSLIPYAVLVQIKIQWYNAANAVSNIFLCSGGMFWLPQRLVEFVNASNKRTAALRQTSGSWLQAMGAKGGNKEQGPFFIRTSGDSAAGSVTQLSKSLINFRTNLIFEFIEISIKSRGTVPVFTESYLNGCSSVDDCDITRATPSQSTPRLRWI